MTPKDCRSAFEDGVLAGFAFACNFAVSGDEHGVPLASVVNVLHDLATNPETARIVADYSDEVREAYLGVMVISPLTALMPPDAGREADRVDAALAKLMKLIPHTHDADPSDPINLN